MVTDSTPTIVCSIKRTMDSTMANYKLCSLVLVGSIARFTSRMSAEQNYFFNHNDIRQLSLKWFWLFIIEHQRQSKTPKQSFLLLMLYDVQSLWSKLVLLSDIFHHLNQLNKKLQNRDKSILKNLLHFKMAMVCFKEGLKINCLVTWEFQHPQRDDEVA